jgi:putative ABC transport system ATP-binding protein
MLAISDSILAASAVDKSVYLVGLRNVTKFFETGSGRFTALDNVTLQIAAGEMVAIVGKSGSGKSTLLNMITGIDRPTSGEIRVGDANIHALSEDALAAWRGRNAGIVFQFFQLIPNLSVVENIMLPMDFARVVPRKERHERALHVLEMVGMAEHAFKVPGAVSGGQQQRVAIARALANDPALLVADEPTGNLDSNTADQIFSLFQSLSQRGKTVVVVTHDQEQAKRVRRAVIVADGRVVDDQVNR